MTRHYGILTVLSLAICFLFNGLAAHGQEAEALPVEVDADRLEYDSDQRVLQATGNVTVRQGEDVLKADFAEVYRDTQDVVARGNVRLQRGGETWEGEELTYNFQTKEGDFGEFDAFSNPFYISAGESQRLAGNTVYLEDALLTTCEGDNPDFSIRAGEATIEEGETLRAKNVFFYFGSVPVFYVPYVKKHLRHTNIDLVPGYSSEMGAFLLTAYTYPITPTVKGTTHLDLRSERGVAIGQDFAWDDPEGQYNGQVEFYYLNDQEPFEDEEEEALLGDLIEENRGRVHLEHFHSVNDRAYVLAELNWLSDPDVLEDFFDNEFRNIAQPENRLSLTHRGDWYTSTLLVNKKLNDFYDNVDRLPSASFDINRQRIGDSPFYYEGVHDASFLRADFADDLPVGKEAREDYDSFRFDSDNLFLYPTRHFGFLNVIPRAGYRATYYSNTRETITTTEEVETTDEETGLTMVETVETPVDVDDGADLRNLFEVGFETSFKAFKRIHDDRLWGHYEGLRHITEPFANYTYVDDPNRLPSELYQFDEVDRLDKRNDIRFGVRNKWQTRKNKKYVHDLVDSELFLTYFLDPDRDENDFGPLGWDVELRPVRALAIDFDGLYDAEDSNLDEFNTQVGFVAPDDSRVNLEYRFRDSDSRDLVTGELDLFPASKWSLYTYWRYDLEEAEIEEQEYLVSRKSDCLSVGVGYRFIEDGDDDDHLVWVELYLLAFPDSLVRLGR